MTVAAGTKQVPREPSPGPAPFLQHVCHMSSDELSAVIAPCFTHIQQPKPWPQVPLLSPHDAHDWLEYTMCATGDLLNDRSVAWSWDSLDLPPDMHHFVASCWTDGTKKPLLLFVGNPARLGDHVWNDYKALCTLPKDNRERPLTPAECIYIRISEICRENGAAFFVLSSYTTWSFGIFDHYGGACRVSAPLRPPACPPVLLAWIYSASGCEGAIKRWDYMEHQLQQQLQAEISTQYAEFERLAYEQARENTVKLADEGERAARARRQEQARRELVTSHEQRQRTFKNGLIAYHDSRYMAKVHTTLTQDFARMVSAPTPASTSIQADADSFDEAATPSHLSESAAPSPSTVAEENVFINVAAFTPRQSPRMPPARMPVEGLTYMTPTVPNSSIRSGDSSSSPLTPSSMSSSTSPGSNWHGMEPQPQVPPRAAHHAPSSSVDSVENILAANPSISTAVTNLANTCEWDNDIQSKFVQHMEQINVFPVRNSPAFGGHASGPVNMNPFVAPGYAMPMDSAPQPGSYGGNFVGWDVQCMPGTYPPSDFQDQIQYYPTNTDTWAPQGEYNVMVAQVPFVHNDY